MYNYYDSLYYDKWLKQFNLKIMIPQYLTIFCNNYLHCLKLPVDCVRCWFESVCDTNFKNRLSQIDALTVALNLAMKLQQDSVTILLISNITT